MTPLDASRSPGDASEPGLVAAEVLAGRALAGPEAASDASTCAAETRIGLFDISSATRTGLSGFVNDRVHRACGVGRPGIARVSSDPGIDEPLAMSKAGSLSYFSVDGLGSVVATNDPSGTVTHSVVFDAWGNVKAETGTRTHPFTYTGREVGEAGLHFYRARFYQPGIGRFLQEDPLGVTGPDRNLYRYVGNGPSMLVDPSGLQGSKSNAEETKWQLFWDWVFERGPQKRYYGADTPQTKEMQRSQAADSMRWWYWIGNCEDGRGHWDSGLAAGEMLGNYWFLNPTASQVGGFVYRFKNNGNGTVTYSISNQLSIYSFFLHIPFLPNKPRRSETKPGIDGFPYMGNLDQVFEWTECSPCEKNSAPPAF